MATVETNSPICMGGGDCMGGFGGGGFIWAFLIFALLMGGGNGFGWGGNGFANAIGYENLATSSEVQRGFDNQNVMANQRETLAAINDASARGIAATNQVYHDVVQNLGDKYSELARDIAGVGAGVAQAIANQCQLNGDLKLQLSETGNGINANIAQNRFDAALNTAAINATTTAIGQKILDKMSDGENRALQNRVNQLELDRALCGVIRYQPNLNFGAVQSPFGGIGYNGYPVYA